MDPIFWIAVKECRKYSFGIGKVEDIIKVLKHWEDYLKTHSHTVKLQEFKEINYNELSRMYFTLIDIKSSTVIRGYVDRIFKNMLGISKQHPTFITVMFARFIKGITYFGTEEEEQKDKHNFPIYHRLHSCGTGSKAFRDSYLICRPSMQLDKRRVVRKQIETCYLERLIYDHIYRYQMLHFPTSGSNVPSQDKGHVHWMEQTKEDFKTCFPNLNYIIEIDYVDNLWPHKLTIIKYLRTREVSKETYVKNMYFDKDGVRIYDSFVECTRNTIYEYKKVQGFRRPDKWIRQH